MEITNPPRALWFQPAGTVFSVRHSSLSRWAGIVISPDVLDTTMEQARDLQAGYSVCDDLVANLFLSLVTQVSEHDRPDPRNARLTESLIRSFLLAVGSRHSIPTKQAGGITPFQIARLSRWVEANLSDKLNVEAMARMLGLSAGHFSRAFKRSTGTTPWDFVIGIRASAAHRMLEQGDRPADVAVQCGFFDQAHLSRVLKSHYGMTPACIRRKILTVT